MTEAELRAVELALSDPVAWSESDPWTLRASWRGLRAEVEDFDADGLEWNYEAVSPGHEVVGVAGSKEEAVGRAEEAMRLLAAGPSAAALCVAARERDMWLGRLCNDHEAFRLGQEAERVRIREAMAGYYVLSDPVKANVFAGGAAMPHDELRARHDRMEAAFREIVSAMDGVSGYGVQETAQLLARVRLLADEALGEG